MKAYFAVFWEILRLSIALDNPVNILHLHLWLTSFLLNYMGFIIEVSKLSDI